MAKTTSDIIIDAVITWVDGNDKSHRKKINQYLEVPEAKNNLDFASRYGSMEEIKYTVHSIMKYAPFIRKIFIVTDTQEPKFLSTSKKYKKVEIINHQEIFKEDSSYLPVFNSRSIETKLYNIPGLSEHYIYFNDDMFLLHPTTPSDFFVNGNPVLRGNWHKFKKDIFIKRFSLQKKKNHPGHIKAQEKGAQLLGLKNYFRFHHNPQPQRKSTLQGFFKSNRNLEIANIQPRFRSPAQFIPHFLANHLELIDETGFTKSNYQLLHFRSYTKPLFYIRSILLRNTSDKNILFLNLQNLDQCSQSKQKFIFNWLEEKYPLSEL